jgi:methionyl-tRNA formyltransferase
VDLIFCGTPQFSVPTLEKLIQSGFAIKLVVTQPDRPRGRGMEVIASPVKQLAHRNGIPIAQPEKIKSNPEFRSQLEAIRPEAIIVVAYGRIIPQWMIDLPPLSNLNLHASLLPKYRGAAPIQWAIANGETVTGATTMRIDAGLDTGDMLVQREVTIADEDTAVTLSPRLAEIGAELMVETLHGLQAGTIHPQPQNDSEATVAPLLKKEDGQIDFSRSAREIYNRLRGFQPWPGAFTSFRGRTLNVWWAMPVTAASVKPVELHVENSRLLVGCSEGSALEMLEVQPEGKRRMSATEFINGYQPKSGERLA